MRAQAQAPSLSLGRPGSSASLSAMTSGELTGRSARDHRGHARAGLGDRPPLPSRWSGRCLHLRPRRARLGSRARGVGGHRRWQPAGIGRAGRRSDPDDVRRLVAATLRRLPALTILVNNAGVYGPKGMLEQVEWREWTSAIQTNLFGSVLPSRELIPHFKQRGYGKIIQLSGGGATRPLPGLSAYAASKAAVVRFAETLAEELRAHGVDVNAVAPGALNTGMLDEVLSAGPERVGQAYYQQAPSSSAREACRSSVAQSSPSGWRQPRATASPQSCERGLGSLARAVRAPR